MSKVELDRVLYPLAEKVKAILFKEGIESTPKWLSTSSFAEEVRRSFEGESPKHIASLLAMAEELLELSFDESDALQKWHTSWYAEVTEPASIFTDTIENTYVRSLTAVWLGLYFMGVPFWHLWERVRQWEDEKGGGLPSGACVAKAIGDIVRSARMRAIRKSETTPEPLIIQSGWPIILFEYLMTDGPDAEDCACILGRYYEFLQLYLYSRSGYPLYYYVTEAVIADKLDIKNKKAEDRPAVLDQWKKACERLRESFFKGHKENQVVYVLAEPKTPPCFINHAEGLFTFEEYQGKFPLSAGYMRQVRRALYVQTFAAETHEDSSRKILDVDDKDTLFNVLWERFNPQSK
jgi:hypothetical protein